MKNNSGLNSNQDIESTSTEKVPVKSNAVKSINSSISSTCNTVGKIWIRPIETMMKDYNRYDVDKNCLEEKPKNPTNNMDNLKLPTKLAGIYNLY